MSSNAERRSQAKIVTRTYGTRHRAVADVSDGMRVTRSAIQTTHTTYSAPEALAPSNGIAGITDTRGMIPMRAKLPSSMEPAKHDIDVPELPALPQVSELAPELAEATELRSGVSGLAAPATDSGVFLSPDLAPDTDVTLVVYAWHNVQPGVLSWIFPTARAALSAAYAMRNAVHWAIVRGRAHAEDLDIARLTGDVLIENT
jgi:hypothetical protein